MQPPLVELQTALEKNITRQVKVKAVDLYRALFVVPHTPVAQVRHTVLPANYALPARGCLYLVSVHQMAPPQTEVADI